MILKPSLHSFKTCLEFAEEFQLGERDLVLTNKYIYEPWFGQMGLKVHTIYQEEYGTGEPTDVMVDAILADAAKTGCTRVIAIGGGTVIDIAKVLAVSDSEGVDELYDKAPNLEKKRELVIIPTTCGTGSEVTNISIMARTRLGTKLGLVSPSMYADHAVLIPELLEGLPFSVFATSSIDALVHAVESSLSPKATPYTKLFGYKAIEMIYTLYDTRMTSSKSAGGAVTKARNIKDQEDSVRSSLDLMYKDLKQKQKAYEASETLYEAAKADKAAADRKNELGMMSRQEYLQAESAWLSSEASHTAAKLDLTGAIENYQWALEGLLDIGSSSQS